MSLCGCGFVKKKQARQWWCMPVIAALGKQRQADFCARGQPDLQSEFQDSQDPTEKPCLEKNNNKKKNKKKKKKKRQNPTKPTRQHVIFSEVTNNTARLRSFSDKVLGMVRAQVHSHYTDWTTKSRKIPGSLSNSQERNWKTCVSTQGNLSL